MQKYSHNVSQNNSFFLKAKLQIIPCSQNFFFVHSHISSHFLRKMKKNVKMANLVKLLDYHQYTLSNCVNNCSWQGHVADIHMHTKLVFSLLQWLLVSWNCISKLMRYWARVKSKILRLTFLNCAQYAADTKFSLNC